MDRLDDVSEAEAPAETAKYRTVATETDEIDSDSGDEGLKELPEWRAPLLTCRGGNLKKRYCLLKSSDEEDCNNVSNGNAMEMRKKRRIVEYSDEGDE